MSIFKKHESIADRSATDRRRHKKKIDKAIKEGIHDIVAEESIIGQDGKKKIRIPVRGIKEYKFIFDQGNNSKGVGSWWSPASISSLWCSTYSSKSCSSPSM